MSWVQVLISKEILQTLSGLHQSFKDVIKRIELLKLIEVSQEGG